MTIPPPPTGLEAGLRRVDELADRAFAGWHVPGLAYGVVLGTELIHSRGLGTLRVGEDVVPDAGSVFRIASMTKSFTAATVLALRDEGRLALDDPIARHVPDLAGLRLPTTDSPPITIRHLLTMTAGFPTDDPWGDRQQGLELEAFSRLLAGGLSFAWVPGYRFEYSNLGYGILGRLITNVAGREYREVVRERFLEPLGMTATTYLESEVPEARKALGYLWRDERYQLEPIDGYGALASMGGIFTTVEDLARWVGGFIDAWPPRDDPERGHPLSRASRREMQTQQVAAGLRVGQAAVDDLPDVENVGYGFGLFMIDDLRSGRIVGHGGGYPGFGSHMRWHPSSGLGVITLANHRYAPASLLARDQIAALLAAEAAPIRHTSPNDLTRQARRAVEALIREWDDERAAQLFAMNVELDEPIAQRRAAIARMREIHGTLTTEHSTPVESITPFHLAWWLNGDRGRVRVEILLTPERQPRIQAFSLTSVPEPPPALAAAAEQILAAVASAATGGAFELPAGLVLGPDVDVAAVHRALRATEARFAPLQLGPVIDGDGQQKATFRLRGERGHVDLALVLDPESGCLTSVALSSARLGTSELS